MLGANKFYFVSLGCPRNRVDSEVMIGLLLKAGYECVEQLERADILIVNTCGFLDASRKESYETVEELLSHKKEGARVIVTGCAVQSEENLRERFPDVHYLLGSGNVDKILQAVVSEQKGEAIGPAKSYLESGDVPRTLTTPGHFAYLKIAEGCRKGCAFCLIPSMKGPLRSKPREQVVKEFHALLDQGVFEIILIAQDLGDYGKDRGEKGALVSLLREILKSPRAFWVRLLYLYPDEVDEGLIEVMQSDFRICPYVDMPIQHINDTVLKAMRRTTNRAQIVETIHRLRRALPEISIRTTLLVGFPGETEEQFKELVRFVEEEALDQVGIFAFSSEEGTSAARFDGQIAEKEKQKRVTRLAKTQQKIVHRKNQAWVGRKTLALIDGVHPDSPLLLAARHTGQCPEVDGRIIINDAREGAKIGMLNEVEITDVSGYDLIGRTCGGEKHR